MSKRAPSKFGETRAEQKPNWWRHACENDSEFRESVLKSNDRHREANPEYYKAYHIKPCAAFNLANPAQQRL